MKKQLRYRVIYGYQPNQYVSIDESLLEKAKYAFITKSVISLGNKTISGSEIKFIEPDYRYYTGWNDTYQFGNEEDRQQIKRDAPTLELEERDLLATARVNHIISTDETYLLDTPEQITLDQWANKVTGITKKLSEQLKLK